VQHQDVWKKLENEGVAFGLVALDECRLNEWNKNGDNLRRAHIGQLGSWSSMTGIFPRPEDDPKTVEPMTMKELNDIQALRYTARGLGEQIKAAKMEDEKAEKCLGEKE